MCVCVGGGGGERGVYVLMLTRFKIAALLLLNWHILLDVVHIYGGGGGGGGGGGRYPSPPKKRKK